jgi:hypothetical protein
LNELLFQLMALVPSIRSELDEVEGADAEMRRLQPIIDERMEVANDFIRRRIANMDSHANGQLLREAIDSHKSFAERKLVATARQLKLADRYNAVMFAGMKNVAAAATSFLALARAELGMEGDASALALQQEKVFDRALSALTQMRQAIGIDETTAADGEMASPK